MSDLDTAFDRLGIPRDQRDGLRPEAPIASRMMIAKALLPVPPDVLLSMVFVLMADPDRRVSKAARKTLRTMDAAAVIRSIRPTTAPKLLEFLARWRHEDQDLMEVIYRISGATDETACIIAETCEEELLEVVVRNQERLLITPDVYLALKRNPLITPARLERVMSFLRLHHALPEEPEEEEAGEAAVEPSPTAIPPMQMTEALRYAVQAEVDAALRGLPSPTTNPWVYEELQLSEEQQVAVEVWEVEQSFGFDPESDGDWGFSLDLIEEGDVTAEEKLNMTQRIGAMSPGQKIKLAYLGNGEARKILMRDSNKLVVLAVVKSGRMTDGELVTAAGNRNLPTDVFREIGMNREAMRKYPIKVALANNPKCPVSIAMGLVKQLNGADLARLARNKNVSSVISGSAMKKLKESRAS